MFPLKWKSIMKRRRQAQRRLRAGNSAEMGITMGNNSRRRRHKSSYGSSGYSGGRYSGGPYRSGYPTGGYSDRRRRRAKRKRAVLIAALILLVVALAAGITVLVTRLLKKDERTKPNDVLAAYYDHILRREYSQMYALISPDHSGGITEAEFADRNSAIYEGIGLSDLDTEVLAFDEETLLVRYQVTYETAAGEVSFENEAQFLEEEERFALIWRDDLIFPGLYGSDKVRVSTTLAERGQILDRNGRMLAGPGTASSVGIVPGKLTDRESAFAQLSDFLGVTPETIEKQLSASWVKDDSFVPVRTIPKVDELALQAADQDPDVLAEYERQQQLLAIPGVMITDTTVRSYPLGEAASHLIGYVQNVTAEDLLEHEGEGYTANSVIGRTGAESLFETELKGQNGCRIYIIDESGQEKREIASVPVENGQDVRLTIDSELQKSLYEQTKTDESCSVAMNPYTGEVLALVSTPSYDDNDFILGLSGEQWTALNEDERQPMYNRYRQSFCPGSTFKSITAAIGLESGAINADEDYGMEGLSWQKDASWGSYYVTTLHAYDKAVLQNALIYSDNIYFAKAALRIGADAFVLALDGLGFGEEIPFEIRMTASQYSNTETIDGEIGLADSGYGQGQMLVSPLHMAGMYSAFCNEGNMIRPYLVYADQPSPEYWIAGAFSADTAGVVLEGLRLVVNDPNGTGYGAHREDVALAGKTGTAEIKASKDDDTGTELGWFVVFTPERDTARPVLIVTMVEDVKERGGSGYVVEKSRGVLDVWFGQNGE